MSELISSVELKKADGNPIKFNFQFENGLPIKPVINATYKEGIHNKEKIPVLIVYLNKEQEKIYKNESIEKFICEVRSRKNILWIDFNSFYICLEKVNSSKYSKLYLGILDEKEKCLSQVLLDAS